MWWSRPLTDAELRKRALRELWGNATITSYDFHDGREVNRRMARPRAIRDFAELFNKMKADIQDKLFDLGDAMKGLGDAAKGATEAMRKAFNK